MFSIRSCRRKIFFRESRKRLDAVDIKDKFVRVEHLMLFQAQYEHKQQEMEAQLTKIIRQFQATLRVIDLLVCSTPRPDVFLRNWQRNVPELIDYMMEDVPGPDIPEHLAEPVLAWQDIVRHYTQILEQMAAQNTPPD